MSDDPTIPMFIQVGEMRNGLPVYYNKRGTKEVIYFLNLV